MGVGPSATLLARPQFGAFVAKRTSTSRQPTLNVYPKRTLVGPCGRLVNFHDRLACLDLLADSVTHNSNFAF